MDKNKRMPVPGETFTVELQDLQRASTKRGTGKASRLCVIAQALDRNGLFHEGCWSNGVQLSERNDTYIRLEGAQDVVRLFDDRMEDNIAAMLPVVVTFGKVVEAPVVADGDLED